MIKLLNPPYEFADEITGDNIDLDITIGGVTKKINFRVIFRTDREVRLMSAGDVAYCQRNNGKIWPTSLMIDVMTKFGRSRDVEFPARIKTPTWAVFQSTVRLNNTYYIRGWWHESMAESKKKSRHSTYSNHIR